LNETVTDLQNTETSHNRYKSHHLHYEAPQQIPLAINEPSNLVDVKFDATSFFFILSAVNKGFSAENQQQP
jgi:hypothetical protein